MKLGQGLYALIGHQSTTRPIPPMMRPLPSHKSQSGHFTATFGVSSADSDDVSLSEPSVAAKTMGVFNCAAVLPMECCCVLIGWTENAAVDVINTSTSGTMEEIIVAFTLNLFLLFPLLNGLHLTLPLTNLLSRKPPVNIFLTGDGPRNPMTNAQA